jgi:prepilin-type N-terminal cleavage/methylation domain-containing protein
MNRSQVHPGRAPPLSGFTLIEVVVSLAILGVIATAISSVIVLASRALPSARGAGESTVAATTALDQLGAELRTATTVTETTATSITFTVPDRTGDTIAETIRYSWAGAGSPLIRVYNGDSGAALIESVNSLAFAYAKRKVTTTGGTITTTIDSGEVLLASFTGWSGITPTVSTSGLSATSFASEAFTVDKVTFPSDTTKWSVSRVSLRVSKSLLSTASILVSVHQPAGAGSPIVGTPVGSTATISAGLLGTGPTWQDAAFSDVTFTDRTLTNLVLRLKATGAAQVEYYTSASAPIDATTFLWSTDSGSTWLPSTNRNRNDARFFVYGNYQRQVQTVASVDTYYLGSVNITLQPTADPTTRVDGGFALLNQPQVPGP